MRCRLLRPGIMLQKTVQAYRITTDCEPSNMFTGATWLWVAHVFSVGAFVPICLAYWGNIPCIFKLVKSCISGWQPYGTASISRQCWDRIMQGFDVACYIYYGNFCLYFVESVAQMPSLLCDRACGSNFLSWCGIMLF